MGVNSRHCLADCGSDRDTFADRLSTTVPLIVLSWLPLVFPILAHQLSTAAAHSRRSIYTVRGNETRGLETSNVNQCLLPSHVPIVLF